MDNLNPEQIKQMINMLKNMLPDADDAPQDSSQPKPNPIKTADRRPRPSSVNKFEQMAERNMHREDVEIDKKLAKYDPTPRSRQFNMIEVTCRVCGKKESINPVLLADSPDRHKCNTCSGSAG